MIIKKRHRSPALINVIFLNIAFLLFISSDKSFSQGNNFNFNIEAQALSTAIVEFSDLTGIQFFYTDRNLAINETAGVSGEMQLIDAINKLFDGTDYTYEFTNVSTVRVFKIAIEPTVLTASSASEEESNREDTDKNQSRIIEITTTSQRRRNEQNLQDVPATVNLLSRDDLELQNFESFRELNELIPNLSIRGGGTTGYSVGIFVVRGIPGVTRYLDGVAQPLDLGALYSILELERIEVLKGPQGTLFGKNAMGGTIRYISQMPGEELAGRVKLTFGNFNRKEISANIDIPITDTFFTKLTAAKLHKDGYVQSAVDDIKYGDENFSIFRFQANWTPQENLNLYFGFTSNQQNPNYQQANVLYDVIENNAMVQAYNANGLIFTDASHAFGKQQQYLSSSTYTGTGNIWDDNNINLTLNWDVNDSLSVSSIMGLREFSWGTYSDLDASRFAYFEQWQYTEATEKSYEFQLQGNTNKLNWTGGLYFSRVEDQDRHIHWQFEEVNPRPVNALTYTTRFDRAIFGEASYQLTDNFILTLGARHSIEFFENTFYIPSQARPPWQQISFNLEPGVFIQNNSQKFSATTPRIALQYDWNDRDLMSYFSYSEGFNGGGFNNRPTNGEFVSYVGESLSQFELGLRSDLFDTRFRFNASLFWSHWQDIQVGEVIVPGIITTRNAGEANVHGLDIEATWSPNNKFKLDFNLGLMNSSYTNVAQALTITENSALALSPDKSFSIGGTYYWTLNNTGLADLNINYGWLDDHVSISDIRLQDKQNSYGLLNANLRFTTINENWSLAFFAKNLTNEWYQLGGFSASLAGVNQGVVARPRELGLSLSASF